MMTQGAEPTDADRAELRRAYERYGEAAKDDELAERLLRLETVLREAPNGSSLLEHLLGAERREGDARRMDVLLGEDVARERRRLLVEYHLRPILESPDDEARTGSIASAAKAFASLSAELEERERAALNRC